MPTNDTTKTLDYDQRLLISNNELHPIAWYVTNVNDVQPIGITQIVFSQSQFDPKRDNAELMIADYYSSSLTPEEKIDPPPKPIGDHSRITFNGTQQVLKINGSYKTFTPHFYDHDLNELDINPVWSMIYPSLDDVGKFDIIHDGKNLKVKCLNYYDLMGKVVTICLNDESGTMPSTLDLEVVSL